MTELKRHQLVYRTLRPICELFARWKFNYTFDSLKDIEGPYLLLPNHNLELDPLLVGVSAYNHMYFVASEHLQQKGNVTKLLNYFIKPISRQKGTSGANTVAKILRTLRGGTSVCIFPEGNRSFNGLTGEIVPATGKMARRSGAKLITYRIEGGYLTQPRWSLSLRRGKIRGKLVRVYSPEELAAMTDQQVNEAICRDLYEDAYETQSRDMVPFKGKNLALGMESTVFSCPDCGKIGTLHSDSNHLICSCGFRAKYDAYGYLTTEAGAKYTISQLDAMQREKLCGMIGRSDEQALFSDEITLQEIGEDHVLISSQAGTLTAYSDRLEVCGLSIPYADLQGLAIYSRNVLVFFTNSENRHYEVRGNVSFSALKYQYWFDMKREEG